VYEKWVRGKEDMLLSDDHKHCRINEVKVFSVFFIFCFLII